MGKYPRQSAYTCITSRFQRSDPASNSTHAVELAILTVPMMAEELSDLAAMWQAHVKSASEEIALLNLELLEADSARSQAIRDELTAVIDRQSDIQQNYATVLDSWEAKGATEEQTAVHTTYINALRVEAVRTTDLRTVIQLATNWHTEAEGGLGFC